MSVIKRPRTTHFHYDFVAKGHRFSGSTGCTDRRSAEAFERAEKLRVKAQISATEPTPSMSMDAAVDRYWVEVGQHGKEHDLWSNLARLNEWVGPSTPLSAINNEMLARLVARRRAEFRTNAKAKDGKPVLVSAARVNRSITELLRRIHTRARKVWEITLVEPRWGEHLLKEPRERVRELTFAEEAAIEAVETPDYRPIRLFMLQTGLRRREAVGLTWAQVDWSADMIRVVQKGGSPHEIPLTPTLVQILWPLREHHETAVFTYVAQRTRKCATSGREIEAGKRYPITYQGLATDFARTLKAAGVTNYRLHDNRHTAATRTLRASKNLPAVQKMLGHSNIGTSMKYAHVLKDDVADAMNARVIDEAARRAEFEERENSRTIPALKDEKPSKRFRSQRKKN